MSLADSPLVRFLERELAPFPGRLNVMLRCLLTSAIVIVVSLTLEVPSLALSLLVVFYVTQSNVVITRLVGLMFIIGSTLAIGSSILLLKFTFDYPLLRIVAASVLFFCSVYLIRVLRIGVVFFIVAVIVIYVQSFVDQTDQADLLIRSVLWVWVAVNYPIALTLLVNALLLPAEPRVQLEAEMHRQLMSIVTRLSQLIEGNTAAPISIAEVQQGALTLQRLLRFTTMRDARYREQQALRLAGIATVSRLLLGASRLPLALPRLSAAQRSALDELRVNCVALDDALVAHAPYRYVVTTPAHIETDAPGAVPDMQRALHAFADLSSADAKATTPPAAEPMLAPDAWTNPVYARFALKTLLAVLPCYVFYNAADWQGIHTIMLTCVIVALPSLGASAQRALLRVAGALCGSALALFMVVFVVPHLDDIVGLLLMTVPVLALGAWIGAGSERIGYAGVQLVFTFSLALLEQFGPTTNLTEIRDRLVGILLGVGVATFVQMAFWREGEGDALRQKLASVLRAVAASFKRPGSPADEAAPSAQWRAWNMLADCEATLSRVALEPNWQEGEPAQLTMRAQTVLAQTREIMLAANALDDALAVRGADPLHTADALRTWAGDALARYADDLAASPPVALAPARSGLSMDGDAALAACAHNLERQIEGLPDWRGEASVAAPVSRAAQA
ncbi:multidrug transporter [Caballeronia novacaledonica]|uniref:Multidrug transporter n=1 Tax=Caballeronia novacaledonica TaxID=1544861 RepID=A0A2U3HY64_9BURK|nr:FUSC family protein [Caballeronia novacaledonica]SPB12739.1 multidrug transporter [Caballeronia novacaledonica]